MRLHYKDEMENASSANNHSLLYKSHEIETMNK